MAQYSASTHNRTSSSGAKTASLTPSQAGDLLFAIGGNNGVTADPTVVDDQGGTYSKITSALTVASADKYFAYVRDTRITNVGVAHVLTWTPGSADTGGGPLYISARGLVRDGLSAVRQSAVVDNGTAGATPTATFGLSINSANVLFYAVFNATNVSGITGPAGFSPKWDIGYGTPTTGSFFSSLNNGGSGTSLAATNTSASDYCLIALELDASAISGVKAGSGVIGP